MPSWPLGLAEGVVCERPAGEPTACGSVHSSDEFGRERVVRDVVVVTVEASASRHPGACSLAHGVDDDGGDVDGATDRLLRSSFAWVFEPTPRGEAVHFRWEPKAAFAGGSRLIAVEEEQDVAFGVAFGKLLCSDHAWAFQLGPGVPLAPFTWRPNAAFEREEGWRVCGRRRSWSGWAPALLQQARRRVAWLGLVVASAEATTWPPG